MVVVVVVAVVDVDETRCERDKSIIKDSGNRGGWKRVNQSRRSPKTTGLTGTPHRLMILIDKRRKEDRS